MNILFLTVIDICNINERGIYNDLLRKFKNEGHKVFVISPSERRKKINTQLVDTDGVRLLKLKTLNIQKTNINEKGLGIILLEYQMLLGIKKYFPNVSFDLILYSTPPITYTKIITYVKKRDGAKAYLLLKDIFPQNAIDIGLMRENSLLHKYFRIKEKKLYGKGYSFIPNKPVNIICI